MEEAKAWIKKYFRIDSEFRGDEECKAKARKANKLISRPIQATSQEEADIVTKEPEIRRRKKSNFHGRINIKRRRVP